MITQLPYLPALAHPVSLAEVPGHYASIRHSPYMMEYLATVLRRCPPGSRALEIGLGSGYPSVWLSLRGVCAEGIDPEPSLVERVRQVNNILGGHAMFRTGDCFHLFDELPLPGADTSPASRKRERSKSKSKSHSSTPCSDGISYTPSSQLSTINSQLYSVIHHQGILHKFTVPQIRATLAQQVALAEQVVFSVPSVYSPFEPGSGRERLMPLEEWEAVLAPFIVEELRYYGDPQLGQREQILCVIRGEDLAVAKPERRKELLESMAVPEEPYPDGFTAIIHTHNEAARIADCLASLTWVDQIILCDMESTDGTLEIAREILSRWGIEEKSGKEGARQWVIIKHPKIDNFDRARNVSAMRARFRWIVFVDADERVPAGMADQLRSMVENSPTFDALLLPFRHYFGDHWMRWLHPGYTSPRLFRNGHFFFNTRLHAGAQVDGPTSFFPGDDPNLAIVHLSYNGMHHYVDKMNAYTDGEAANLHRDGHPFHWRIALRKMVTDLRNNYDAGMSGRDGPYGLMWAVNSGIYRLEQEFKLYEKRLQSGQLQPFEQEVPPTSRELFEFALSLYDEQPLPAAKPIQVVDDRRLTTDDGPTTSDRKSKIQNPKSVNSQHLPPIIWSGPLRDPSGYGEESRNFLFALADAGMETAAQSLPWSHNEVEFDEEEQQRFAEMEQRSVPPGFIHITQNFPTAFQRHPQAGISIGRTMFETDRLPQEWVKGCNRMDYIWVPSEFNRQTFAHAGVEEKNIVVMPGCFDPDNYSPQRSQRSRREFFESISGTPAPSVVGDKDFMFLSVFDWTRHKGWDVLLQGFAAAFQGRSDVVLALKVWSTNNYTPEDIRRQAAELLNSVCNLELSSDEKLFDLGGPRILFLQDQMSRADLIGLYHACDCFVLPSRGEGWGRPYMEAMACGKPVIGTNWSGSTAFMTAENSYLLNCEVVPVPEIGWREIPTYRGHGWAEPDSVHLKQLMTGVLEDRGEAAKVAEAGREFVRICFNRERVGKMMREELERIM